MNAQGVQKRRKLHPLEQPKACGSLLHWPDDTFIYRHVGSLPVGPPSIDATAAAPAASVVVVAAFTTISGTAATRVHALNNSFKSSHCKQDTWNTEQNAEQVSSCYYQLPSANITAARAVGRNPPPPPARTCSSAFGSRSLGNLYSQAEASNTVYMHLSLR